MNRFGTPWGILRSEAFSLLVTAAWLLIVAVLVIAAVW